MIKVKTDRDTDNVFFVEDGVTVSYADDVLEVLDEDDAVIAVFRGWLYALPAIEAELLEEDSEAPETGLEEAVAWFEAPETVSSAHTNSHGAYGLADDVTEDPSE